MGLTAALYEWLYGDFALAYAGLVLVGLICALLFWLVIRP